MKVKTIKSLRNRPGKFLAAVISLAVSAGLFYSCAGSPGDSGPVLPEVMVGTGRDLSSVTAIQKAKVQVVNQAVFLLLGEKQYQLYENQLRGNPLDTPSPDNYVFRESVRNLNRRQDGDFVVYELEMRVNWPAIRSAVAAARVPVVPGSATASSPQGQPSGQSLSDNERRARELITGETRNPGTQPGGAGGRTGPSSALNQGDLAATGDDFGTATPEEQAIIRRYVNTLSFLVYYDKESTEEPAVLRSAVVKANDWLAQNSLDMFEINAVEKLIKDRRAIFEESAGTEEDYITWIAQQLNAKVYVEVGIVTQGRSEASTRHNATATLSLKFIDPSSAQALASVQYTTDPMFSRVSLELAKQTAVNDAIVTAFPRGVEQARRYLQKSLVRGFKYELNVAGTSDSRLLSRFRAALGRRVKSLDVLSTTDQSIRYEVFYIGLLPDLEDLIYQVTETIPGLEGMRRVSGSGRTLYMSTGL